MDARLSKKKFAWTYRDATGQPVKRKVRVDTPSGKKYHWERWNGTGWDTGEPDGPQMLFNLPSLVAAEEGATAFVFEGEKTAVAAVNIGLPTATTSGGASSAGVADLGVLNRFSKVLIFADNDPPGEGFAKDFAASLFSRNPNQDLRIVRLPGLPPKGDLVEWIQERIAGWDGYEAKECLCDLRETLLDAAERHGTPWESEASSMSQDNWPEIMEFQSAPMSWPKGVFPPILEQFMEETAWEVQCPREIVAAQMLGVLATVTQGKFVAQGLSTGHIEPLGLFLLAVASPSERKSPAVRALKSPIDRWEAEQAELLAPSIQEALASRRVLERKIAEVEKRSGRKETGASDAAREIVALKDQMPEVPVAPQLLVSDFTVEKLGQLLGTHNGVMACIDAEGTAFDSISGRYRAGRPEPDLFLRGYSGESFRLDRIGRESVHLPRVTLTLSLSVQPLRLAETLADSVFRGLGLTARFVYLVPEGLAGSRKIEARNRRGDSTEQYERIIARMLNTPRPDEPVVLRMSPEAAACWKALAERVEVLQAPGNSMSHGVLSEWAGKFSGAMLRVAALLHLAQWVEQRPRDVFWALDPAEVPPIRKESMAAAVCAADCFLDHALRVFDQSELDAQTTIAKALLKWITRRGQAEFSKRDAHYNLKHLVKRVEELEPPLEILEDRGYIRRRPLAPRLPSGGRPSVKYDVNPKALESYHRTHNTHPDLGFSFRASGYATDGTESVTGFVDSVGEDQHLETSASVDEDMYYDLLADCPLMQAEEEEPF